MSSTSSSLVEEKLISKNVVTPCRQDEEILFNYGVSALCCAFNKALYVGLDNGELLYYEAANFLEVQRDGEQCKGIPNNPPSRVVARYNDGISCIIDDTRNRGMASASLDGRMILFYLRPDTWEPFRIRTYTELNQAAINVISFDDDGKKIASGSKEGFLRIWDVLGSGKCATTIQSKYSVTSLLWGEVPNNIPSRSHRNFKEDHYIIAGFEDGSLSCYDLRKVQQGEPIWTRKPHQNKINKIISLGSGRGLATLSDDCSVHIFPHDDCRIEGNDLQESIYLKHYHNDFIRDGFVPHIYPGAEDDKTNFTPFLLTGSWDGTLKTAALIN